MWIAADAPTSADWLAAWGQVGGAVATTAAVIVALWLAVRDRKWRRADLDAVRRQERSAADLAVAEREERAASQARLVTSTCEFHFVTHEGGDDETSFGVGTRGANFGTVYVKHVVWVTIHNGSAAPIFVPRVEEVSSAISTVVATHHVFRSTPTPREEKGADDGYRVVLKADESVRVPVVCEGEDGQLVETWMAATALIAFTDNDRRMWRRAGTALPTRATSETG